MVLKSSLTEQNFTNTLSNFDTDLSRINYDNTNYFLCFMQVY